MALPSSGQISLNDVRIEMSQSQFNNYSMFGWVTGNYNYLASYRYTPINILSSGSRWLDGVNDNPLRMIKTSSLNMINETELLINNYSMSAWYGYDRNLYINTNITGTLFCHTEVSSYYLTQTMMPVYIGNTDRKLIINVSGTLNDIYPSYATWDETIYYINLWYGKPWNNDGNTNVINNIERRLITSSEYRHFIPNTQTAINFSYEWNYTYTASVGEYLYIVLSEDVNFN